MEINLLTFEEFSLLCEKGACIRKTFISKNCKKETKIKECYKKWLQQKEKKEKKQDQLFQEKQEQFEKYKEEGFPDNKDERWEELRKIIWKRDQNKCQLWKILTQDQKDFILDNYKKEYETFSKTLDCAHIKGRGAFPELKYDENNIVLISRYFHTLIDFLKHPIHRQDITNAQREEWLVRVKN